jgi:hypothetical protein
VAFYRDMKGDTVPAYHCVDGVGALEDIRSRIRLALSL